MVRVRGKRSSRQGSSHHEDRKQGRPSVNPGEKKQVILQKLQQHHTTRQKIMDEQTSKLSRFEKLPIELVQHIFFFSLELNLMQASKTLHDALSTEQIRDVLLTFAYFDDDGQSPVEAKHFLPAEYWRLECIDKVRLQQELFDYGITTYCRLTSVMPTLARLCMVQAWHRERLLEQLHEEAWCAKRNELELVVIDPLLADIAPLPRLDENTKLEDHFFGINSKIATGSSDQMVHSRKSPRIVTWTSSLHDDCVVHKCIDQSVSIVACRHIPNKLLVGPWSKDEIEMLMTLRQGYTFIQDNHILDISAHHIFIGMRNAVKAHNLVVLKILLDMHAIFFKAGSWGVANMLSIEYIAASNHPIPIDVFHLATKQGIYSTSLMQLLIRAGLDSIPGDDEVITAWALHAQKHHGTNESGAWVGDLASWLLRHMEGNQTYGLPRRRHLFFDGALSWRTNGTLPFSTETFAKELGYLDGTPVVPSGLNGKPCGTE